MQGDQHEIKSSWLFFVYRGTRQLSFNLLSSILASSSKLSWMRHILFAMQYSQLG